MKKWNCYIEEGQAETGSCARLRDRETNKEVAFQSASPDATASVFRILSAALEHRELVPSVFERTGKDAISFAGELLSMNEDTIFISIPNGGCCQFS